MTKHSIFARKKCTFKICYSKKNVMQLKFIQALSEELMRQYGKRIPIVVIRPSVSKF